MKRKLLIGAVLLFVCAGSLYFSHKYDQPGGVVVGRFASRDHVVTVFTSRGENLFTVASREGEMKREWLKDSEFEAEFPYLHNQMKTGIADLWAGSDIEARTLQESNSAKTRMLPSQLPSLR